MLIYLNGLLSIKPHGSQVMWSCKNVWQIQNMSTKLGRMVTYQEGLPPLKACDSLIKCLCEIMWQTKNISPPPECLRPPNLAGWWIASNGFHPLSYLTFWFCDNQRYLLVSCKIMWQSKTVISPLPQCLWSPKLIGRWITWRGTYWYTYVVLQNHITN